MLSGCSIGSTAKISPVSKEVSNSDMEGEFETADAVEIVFSENGISAKTDSATISDSTITITKEGTYILFGTLNDGNIIVNAGKGITGKDAVTITGGNYEITSSNAAIRANNNIMIADGVFNITAGTDGIHAEKKGESLGD